MSVDRMKKKLESSRLLDLRVNFGFPWFLWRRQSGCKVHSGKGEENLWISLHHDKNEMKWDQMHLWKCIHFRQKTETKNWG